MKNKRILLIVVLLLAVGAIALVVLSNSNPSRPVAHRHTTPTESPSSEPAVASHHTVPAYQPADQINKLGPTLEPMQFFGKAREAYQVARKIPKTLAQLPCYCHCDRSFGHKSLHSCFEDDHASECAVCVDEALLAYKLQTEQKLTPDQVRDLIVQQYSAQ